MNIPGLELFDKLAGIIKDIYFGSRFLIGSIAVFYLGICGYRYMRAENEQEVNKTKQWMLGICIGLALYFTAPFAVKVLAKAVQAALNDFHI